MTDIDRIYKEDMEYLKENYSKEMQEYEKIGNKKNFNRKSRRNRAASLANDKGNGQRSRRGLLHGR